MLEGGGAADMIDAKDRARVVCNGTPADIAEKVRDVLRHGAIVPRFAVAAERNAAIWRDAQLAFTSPQAHRRFASQAAHRTWNGRAPKSRKVKRAARLRLRCAFQPARTTCRYHRVYLRADLSQHRNYRR